MDKSCSFLKDSLVSILTNELEVSAFEAGCIVTLPLKTADDRFVDVFVERIPNSGFTYVHDGGKSTAELHGQGIHSNDSQDLILRGIARSFGAQFQDGRFQIACTTDESIQQGVLAIAQCASLAMIEVVTHAPKFADELLTTRVQRALAGWRPAHVALARRVPVTGRMTSHQFDFVASSIREEARTVAIKLLAPSVGASWQAARYGFLVYDIASTEAASWARLAIVSKIDEWSPKALAMVKNISNDVILLESDKEERVESSLPGKMTELMDAA